MRVFISHASEDKGSVARPLAEALIAKGINVWLDEFVLKPGDSLRREIDRGLSECGVGVVLLSTSFFAKEWPQEELSGLYGGKILVPVWHDVDHAFVKSKSPLLADKFALRVSDGIEAVAQSISTLVRSDPDRTYEYALNVVAGQDLHQPTRWLSWIDFRRTFGDAGVSMFVDYPRRSWSSNGKGKGSLYILNSPEDELEEIFQINIPHGWRGSGFWERLQLEDSEKASDDSEFIALDLCSKNPRRKDLIRPTSTQSGRRAVLAVLVFSGDAVIHLREQFERWFIL